MNFNGLTTTLNFGQKWQKRVGEYYLIIFGFSFAVCTYLVLLLNISFPNSLKVVYDTKDFFLRILPNFFLNWWGNLGKAWQQWLNDRAVPQWWCSAAAVSVTLWAEFRSMQRGRFSCTATQTFAVRVKTGLSANCIASTYYCMPSDSGSYY